MAIGTPVALGSASNTASGTSVVLTTTDSSPAGASILCAITINNGGAVLSSVTDSAGNTYAIDITRNRGGSAPYVAIASCHNATALASGGTITATFTASLTQAKTIVAQSVTGLASSALDKTGSNSGLAANTWTSGTTGTLAQADEILLAVAMNSGGRANTPATNWTELADTLDADSVAYAVQYRIVSATTALDEGGTYPGSANFSAAVATYKAGSGTTHVTTSWQSSYVVKDRASASWQSSYVTRDRGGASWASSYTTRARVTTTWASSYIAADRASAAWESSYVVSARTAAAWESSYVTHTRATATWESSYSVSTATHSQQTWQSSWQTHARLTTTWASDYGIAGRGSRSWASSWAVLTSQTTSWQSGYDVMIPAPAVRYRLTAGTHTADLGITPGARAGLSLTASTRASRTLEAE